MRTNVIFAMLLSFGVAGALITGSGFAALIGQGDPVGTVDDRVSEQANESTLENGSVSGEKAPGDDASIISLVISGGQRIAEVIGMVVLLPMTLINLGFPPWFAVPVGAPATIIASIGVVQFVTGRVLR
jgi:hypothetical protein